VLDPDEVAPGVFVATAYQYTTTTTIVVGRDGACLLIDPAVAVGELGALADWLAGHGLRPVVGWSTHPHWDHLLWAPALGGTLRYATAPAADVARRERASLIADVQGASPGHDLELFARVEPLAGNEIDWPGPRALIYAHDGHAPGHGAVYLPDTGVLIAGDMLSDIEIPLPDLGAPELGAPDLDEPGPNAAGPFGGYQAGLDLLAGVPGVEVLIPGHGHVGGRAEFHRRVAADRAYLEAVTAGIDYRDDRLTEDWLRAEHARAVALARRALGS
jgi:glyoxylase-like metal-dependent hydrolase (beta-lactamase superfamily II)